LHSTTTIKYFGNYGGTAIYEGNKLGVMLEYRQIKKTSHLSNLEALATMKEILDLSGYGIIKYAHIDNKKQTAKIIVTNPTIITDYRKLVPKSEQENICVDLAGIFAGLFSEFFGVNCECYEDECFLKNGKFSSFKVVPGKRDHELELLNKPLPDLNVEDTSFWRFFTGRFSKAFMANFTKSASNLKYFGKNVVMLDEIQYPYIYHKLLVKDKEKAQEAIHRSWFWGTYFMEKDLKRKLRPHKSILRALFIPGNKILELASVGVLEGYIAAIKVEFEIIDFFNKFILMQYANYVDCHLYKALFGKSVIPICRPTVEYVKNAVRRVVGWDVIGYSVCCYAQGFPSCFVLAIDKSTTDEDKQVILEKAVDKICEKYGVSKTKLAKQVLSNVEKGDLKFAL